MTGFIAAADRHQPMLLPPTGDGFISKHASIRVIDAFVASLDLHGLGFDRAEPAETGRPGYDPALCCGSIFTATSIRCARRGGWRKPAGSTSKSSGCSAG